MPTCPIVPTRINLDEGGNITTATLREVLRMLAKYELCMRPGAPEIMEDYEDEFNEYSNTDLSKCRRIGLKVRYETNWAESLIWQRTLAKKPTAVSLLHNGPVEAPTGPGFWVLVNGRSLLGYISHSPGGCFNTTLGNRLTFVAINSQGIPRSEFQARFCANGVNSGHVITIAE